VRNDDAALYYEVHPSEQNGAPFLILLHGNGEDMSIFEGHIEPLLPYYTVIAMDTRGQGKSSRGNKPLSYTLFADDLFTLINKLQIGSAILLGFSDGGNIALELSLRHQERIAAMILVGANLNPEGLSPLVRKQLKVLSTGQKIKGLFSKETRDDNELTQLLFNHPHIEPLQLATVTVPTLIINGEKDVILEEHSKLITTSLADARRVVIPGATHFVMKDAPEEFDRIVLDFLMEDD
jgi:pimeloyl-ACP methyl ester carboxylesterase